jgi:adenylate cyclase
MFTDIAGFTTLSELADPAVIAPVLNEYLTGTTDIIFEHDGTLMQTTGDGLYVLFGAPTEQFDHAARGVACAIAIDAYAERMRRGSREIELGITRIGVNSGSALVGNFGSGRYFYYNAMGDAVNIAARLEQANKHLGTRICVAESVVHRCSRFIGRPIGDLMLRGRSDALRAYEPLSQDRRQQEMTELYLEAFAKAEVADPAALRNFATMFSRDSSDALVEFHLRRLLNGGIGVSVVLE